MSNFKKWNEELKQKIMQFITDQTINTYFNNLNIK